MSVISFLKFLKSYVNETYDAETEPRPRHWSDGIETRPRRSKKTASRLRLQPCSLLYSSNTSHASITPTNWWQQQKCQQNAAGRPLLNVASSVQQVSLAVTSSTGHERFTVDEVEVGRLRSLLKGRKLFDGRRQRLHVTLVTTSCKQ